MDSPNTKILTPKNLTPKSGSFRYTTLSLDLLNALIELSSLESLQEHMFKHNLLFHLLIFKFVELVEH